MYIFYTAYSYMYVYEKLVNVARTTVRRTKAVALVLANTLEKAQMRKLSNAAEKGDKIFKQIFRGGSVLGSSWPVCLYTVYNFE